MVTPLITGQRVRWRPEDFHVGPAEDGAAYIGIVMGFRAPVIAEGSRDCWHIVGDHAADHAYVLSDASLELAVRAAPLSGGYGQSNQTRLDIVPVRFLTVVDDNDLDTHELLDRLGVRVPRRGQLIGPLPDMCDSHDRLSPAARHAIRSVVRFDVVGEAGSATICDRFGLLHVYSGARPMVFFDNHYTTLHEHERILRLVEVDWRHHMGMDNGPDTSDTVLDSASKGH